MLKIILTLTTGMLLGVIDTHYTGLKILKAHFEQRTTSSATRVVKIENGQFWMDRESEVLRFEYLDPEKKTFLYRRGRVEFYVPADRQLMTYKLDESSDLMPFLFLLGKRRLSDCLSIPTGNEKPRTSGAELLHLQPIVAAKGEGDFFVEVDPATGYVFRVMFVDSLRNRIEIQLDQQQPLAHLPAGFDTIRVPGGVEIVER